MKAQNSRFARWVNAAADNVRITVNDSNPIADRHSGRRLRVYRTVPATKSRVREGISAVLHMQTLRMRCVLNNLHKVFDWERDPTSVDTAECSHIKLRLAGTKIPLEDNASAFGPGNVTSPLVINNAAPIDQRQYFKILPSCGMNSRQANCAQHILHGTGGFSLNRGPPATGKTTIVARIVGLLTRGFRMA